MKRICRPGPLGGGLDQRGKVLLALAQRRHVNVHDVDAVEEVLRNAPVATSCSRSRLVAEMMRTSTRIGPSVAADGLNLAALEESQQFGLHLQAHLADFVEEDRAAVRRFEPPHAIAVGAGEAAADVPEELGLEQRVGDRRAVDGDEGWLRAAEWAWMYCATTSLPTPLSPVMKTLASPAAARVARARTCRIAADVDEAGCRRRQRHSWCLPQRQGSSQARHGIFQDRRAQTQRRRQAQDDITGAAPEPTWSAQ